jgi:demethylmenaquinone methyltransferase/2-methoxy-6-polyprenyl-1,4-benzoquinol methylase
MFDRIAARYDRINRVLSFGMDVGWRRHVARLLEVQPGQRVLDVATGTADLVIALAKSQPRATFVGIDPSEGMLAVGREKIASSGLSDRIALVEGAAEVLPFENASFDAVTIGFGIRNAKDPDLSLREMRRVLKPGGRLAVLEFSMPTNSVIRFFHLLYLRHVLPVIGGLLSGNREAYRYLNRTIETFPSGKSFIEKALSAGFSAMDQRQMALGAVSVYICQK